MSKWQARLKRAIRHASPRPELSEFAAANAAAIEHALAGRGPDSAKVGARAGVRAVVNIASAHVPSFCDRSRNGPAPAYQNAYDLGKVAARAGHEVPDQHWSKRQIVDHALSAISGHPMDALYFLAADLNGTGVRFYGDICLVLKRDAIADETLVLDRNSYDVLRPPLSEQVDQTNGEAKRQAARRVLLRALSGKWKADLSAIGAVKVLNLTAPRDRRLTTGQVAEGLLEDEDYIEVIKHGSFDAGQIEGARLAVADVALEGQIERKATSPNPPSLLEGRWLAQRRDAELALASEGIESNVATSMGRVRS